MPDAAEGVGPSAPVSTDELIAHLRRQSAACGDLGSPLYAALMAYAADDLADGGPVAAVLAGWCGRPGPGALALRLFGTVHRIALTGRAPALARFYPSVAGADAEPLDPAAAGAALGAVLDEHVDELRTGLRSAPQTNEVGRSAALTGALLILRRQVPMPVRLVEIGASAGLNLRPDLIRLELGDGRAVGPADSPVVLRRPWAGDLPPLHEPLAVLDRVGCDLDPVDATTEDGRLRLESYVWPDQVARLSRLRGAIELARRVPVAVQARTAVETVDALNPTAGALTVLWHSVMWQYLAAGERAGLTAAFERLGAAASSDAPVARVSLEPRWRERPRGVEFVVRVRTWPSEGAGTTAAVLATSHPHGQRVLWRPRTAPGGLTPE